MALPESALAHAREVGRRAEPPTPAEGALMRCIWVPDEAPAEQARAS